jgi:peptide deformylase
MALRQVVREGDELLRKKSREVGEITDRIRTLVGDMWDTMYEANGVGLAAPQVGVLRRVAVIDASEPEDEEDEEEAETGTGTVPGRGPEGSVSPLKLTLIDPEIVWRSEEEEEAKEGCLSLPGLVGVVKRPARVRVRARDLNGEVYEVEGEGLLAKALCHELDHLDGVLFTDIALEILDREKDE